MYEIHGIGVLLRFREQQLRGMERLEAGGVPFHERATLVWHHMMGEYVPPGYVPPKASAATTISSAFRGLKARRRHSASLRSARSPTRVRRSEGGGYETPSPIRCTVSYASAYRTSSY